MIKEENGIVDGGAHDMSREEQLVFAEDWFGRSGCLLAVTEIDPKLPLML